MSKKVAVSLAVELVQKKKPELIELCRRFHVRRLELFGSACTEEFDPARSDLDFLVEFPPDYDLGPWLGRFSEFAAALESLLDRPIDLVMPSALRNPWFRKEAERTRTSIYDGSEDAEMAARHS